MKLETCNLEIQLFLQFLMKPKIKIEADPFFQFYSNKIKNVVYKSNPLNKKVT